MPFDALVAPAQPKLLADEVEERGIAAVSLELLAAHQAAQLERFSPSFWYRHQALLPTALLGSVAGMAVSGGLAERIADGDSPLSCWLTLAWMGVIMLLLGAGVFRVRAGSHWEERWVPAVWLKGLGVPEPIAILARDLNRHIPGSALILGELVEEHVVLDPYLVLERDGERVCLGIWDDGGIIAIATLPA
ncbi:MAG TPA: hypothetical protein VGG99_09780 [Acetobacteraceae bacterium]|jgi:hypothetical protein